MKNFIVTMFVFATMLASASALAQFNGASTPYGPVVVRDYAANVTDDITAVQATGTCVSQIRTVCNGYWNAPGCSQVVVECDKLRKKAAGLPGLTKKQVVAIVEKAVAGLASKEELDALARRVTVLEAEVRKLREDVDALKVRQDADDVHNKAQDDQLGDHEKRITALEKSDEDQNKKILVLQDEVMFEGGAVFFGAPNTQILGAGAGLQLRIAENAAMFGDLALGYAFDKDVGIIAKGGVMFYVTTHFGLGPCILFAHESFDDDGDLEVGGGVELRFRTGKGFFVAGDIGLGAEGILKKVGQRPDGEYLTDREYGLAVMGGLMLGGEF